MTSIRKPTTAPILSGFQQVLANPPGLRGLQSLRTTKSCRKRICGFPDVLSVPGFNDDTFMGLDTRVILRSGPVNVHTTTDPSSTSPPQGGINTGVKLKEYVGAVGSCIRSRPKGPGPDLHLPITSEKRLSSRSALPEVIPNPEK